MSLYFLIFQEMELSGSNIKKFLIFSQKKVYISENGNPKKLLVFQEVIFQKVSYKEAKLKFFKYFLS